MGACKNLDERAAEMGGRFFAYRQGKRWISNARILLREYVKANFEQDKVAAITLRVNERQLSAWLTGARRPEPEDAAWIDLKFRIPAREWGLAPESSQCGPHDADTAK